MALVKFVNDNPPYLSAENLNNNFEELERNQIYSEEEQIIGTFMGKTLYRKIIDFGNLPNATTKQVNHNISNLYMFTKVFGIMYGSEGTSGYGAIPLPSTATQDKDIKYSVTFTLLSNTYIQIGTGTDRSAYKAIVICEYTKTTD